ncbi:hypothetical protein VTL71DRAFT_1711 [Oculimacula yallundae]|uniref:Uncharacterized protein n=1 Tax=Oculimacula yallundae TaxID=86028 RepID=A0ABR4CC95_9HELO
MCRPAAKALPPPPPPPPPPRSPHSSHAPRPPDFSNWTDFNRRIHRANPLFVPSRPSKHRPITVVSNTEPSTIPNESLPTGRAEALI